MNLLAAARAGRSAGAIQWCSFDGTRCGSTCGAICDAASKRGGHDASTPRAVELACACADMATATCTHSVYLIESITKSSRYIGYSNDVERRLRQHNGVYMLDVWVEPNPEGDARDTSFPRQVRK